MSNNHKPNPMDEQVAANITALALGELSGEEAARLQQRVDDDPRLQQQVADVRRVAQLLREPTVPAGTPRASSPASSPKTHAAVLVALDRFESDGQLAAVLATDSSVSATASDAAFNVASDVASETPPVMAAKHGGSKYGGSKHGGSKHGGSSNNGSRWVIGILVSLAATVLLAVFVYNPFSDSPWMLSQAVPTSEQARTNNELAGNELAGRELRRGSVQDPSLNPTPEMEIGADSISDSIDLSGGASFDRAPAPLADKPLAESGTTLNQDPSRYRPDSAVMTIESTTAVPKSDGDNGAAATNRLSTETSRAAAGIAGGKSLPGVIEQQMKIESAEQLKKEANLSQLALTESVRESRAIESSSRSAGERAQTLTPSAAAPSGGIDVGRGINLGGVVAGSGEVGGGIGGRRPQERDNLSLGVTDGLQSGNQPLNRLDESERGEQQFYEYGLLQGGEIQLPGDEADDAFGRGRDANNEEYAAEPENPFVRPVGEHALSTFSIDVDTASYTNVRKFLQAGSLPPPAAVRTEEFVNYFDYNYPQPDDEQPLLVDLRVFGCPWNSQHALLRVALQGKEVAASNRPASNIVYLIDVSGSMSSDDKLPLLKRGLQMMTSQLTENDTVSIVTYAGSAGIHLQPTNGSEQRRVMNAIEVLQAGGSTHGSAGIDAAYQLAEQRFVEGGVNRVILATDGDLNVGVTENDALVQLIRDKAASGVFLTVLGFGTGNLKDAKLESIADNGNGVYAYIDSFSEAQRVLVEQMSANLVTIAKDVKIQVEFNPAQVAAYRLIGYENRMLANADFANDAKDAGEIGAGHTVTALYEVIPVGAMLNAFEPPVADLPDLKYQRSANPAPAAELSAAVTDEVLKEAAASGELATVAVRYKNPEASESQRFESTVQAAVTSFSQADEDSRFAAAVAAFAMRLRGSIYDDNISLEAIAEIAAGAAGDNPQGPRAEFVDLVRTAKRLSGE